MVVVADMHGGRCGGEGGGAGTVVLERDRYGDCGGR